MNFKNLDNVGRFLYFGTLVPVFLSLITPILIDSSFLFPFISPKTFFFRILIEIALFFYVLLAFREPEFRPKFSPIVKAVSVFMLIITVASVFGVDPYRSFWGNIERGEGLLTLYHLFALFFIVAQVLKTRKSFEWLLHAMGLVTLIVSIYGLRQFLGDEGVINTGGERLTATIGNAAFFAGYLLFGIFLSLWFAVTRRNLWIRALYVVVGLFELFILIQTETRGAFIGLVAGILVALIIAFLTSKNRRHKTAMISIVLLMGLSTVFVWTQKDADFVQNSGILKRLTTISFDDITTQSRLLTWDSSWRGLKDRPILGYGWENYNIAFNKYFHPEIYRDRGSQIWFDRAHNIIFDISVTSGISGLLAYLSIFVLSVLALYKNYRATDDSSTFSVLFGLFVAYFVSNMFVFDVLATYINFFALLAFIVFIENSNLRETSKTEREKTINKKLPKQAVLSITALSVVLLVMSVYYFNIQPAITNREGLRAWKYFMAENKPREADDLFKRIFLEKNYQIPEIRQKYAEFALMYSSGNSPASARIIDSAIIEIKKSIKEQPLNVQHRLFLMMLYNQSARFNKNRLSLVFDEGQKALELSPTRPQIYYEIARAHIALGDFDKALEAFEKALELQPDVLDSQWNVAVANIYNGNISKASKMFNEMKENGFDYYSDYNLQRMERVFSETGNWKLLANTLEYRIKTNPKNASLYISLARAYELSGLPEKALVSARMAKELDDSVSEKAQAIISRIKSTE